MDADEKARRRAEFRAKALEWAKLEAEIPPCPFCGRVFLAGMCCQARADAIEQERRDKEAAEKKVRQDAKRARRLARRAERRAAKA